MLRDEQVFDLRNLKKFAEKNPLGPDDMKKIMRMGCVIEDDYRFNARLTGLAHVVYTVEDHAQSRGGMVRFRHASVVQVGKKRPEDDLMNGVLEILGFKARLGESNTGVQGSYRIESDDESLSVVEVFDIGAS